MLEHRTPFDSVRTGPDRSGSVIERPGLRVTAVRDRGLLLLQSRADAILQEALAEELGLRLPALQRAATLGEYALLWLTPAEWLLELPVGETDSIEAALTHRLASSLAVVTDLSDALISIEVSGAGAAETLMTGCTLDLRSGAFSSGRVARTRLADLPAILWNPGNPDRLRCFVDRGFVDHLLGWLEGVSPP